MQSMNCVVVPHATRICPFPNKHGRKTQGPELLFRLGVQHFCDLGKLLDVR